MAWCAHCSGYVFESGKHKCPPRWRVAIPDYHEDDPELWYTLYARDAGEAAEKACERVDGYDGEFEILQAEGVEGVRVLPYRYEGETPKMFNVGAETVAQYHAYLVEPADA